MTFEQIFSDLKKGIYHPVYFLMGEETYYIDKITDYIAANVLSESDKAFNQTVVYGKDSVTADIVNTARRFPMMANYQVLIVKEAQNLKDIDDLVYYTDTPLKSTILVVNYKYKKFDKRKKLYKSLQQSGVIFESKKIYEDKVPAWISGYLKEKNYSIDPKSSMMLVEFLGNDLAKIANELDKLTVTLPEGQKNITPLQIEENIGISKDYNNIELQNAMTKGDWRKAARIVDYFSKNPKNNPLVLTITSMYFFFSKVLLYHFTSDKSPRNLASVLRVNPYFVNDYKQAAARFKAPKTVKVIELLRNYDLKSKGVGNASTPDGELLKELVYRIMH